MSGTRDTHLMSTTLIVSSAADTAREWLLTGGTFVLALFTYLLWRSTRAMALKTGEAAHAAAAAALAASASATAAQGVLTLENERWTIEQEDRETGQARATEVRWQPVAGSPGIRFEFFNFGEHTIFNIEFHASVGGSRASSGQTQSVPPGSPPHVTTLQTGMPMMAGHHRVAGWATFTDFNGRAWIKWANEGTIEPYALNPDLSSHWVDPL